MEQPVTMSKVQLHFLAARGAGHAGVEEQLESTCAEEE